MAAVFAGPPLPHMRSIPPCQEPEVMFFLGCAQTIEGFFGIAPRHYMADNENGLHPLYQLSK